MNTLTVEQTQQIKDLLLKNAEICLKNSQQETNTLLKFEKLGMANAYVDSAKEINKIINA